VIDSLWFELRQFTELSFAERRTLLLARRQKLFEQQVRLEQHQWELEEQQVRLERQQQVLAKQQGRLEQLSTLNIDS
jgi:hypothetical protein